jgi:plastocyanin
MRRTILTLTAIAVAALIATPGWAGGGGGHGCDGPITSGRTENVGIAKLCFKPGIVWVDPGTTVTFRNDDPFAHTVTPATSRIWDEAILDPGRSVTVTLTQPGIYPFYCRFHPAMGGALVVGDLERISTARFWDGHGVDAATGASVTARQPVASVAKAEGGAVWPVAAGVTLPAVGLAGYAAGRRRRSS